MTDQRRVNWTISEAAYEAASTLATRYGSLSKVVEIAIDRMYREERMSTIVTKAGITPDDSKTTIAEKLRTWIDSKIPDEAPAYKRRQAELAWNGIFATWGRMDGINEFEKYWKA